MILTLILLAILLIVGVSIYNSLIAKKNNVTNAFGAIDVMLKKRFDLLPNLVDTVKQYMAHENNLLTRLTDLRTRALTGKLDEAEKLALDQDVKKEVQGIILNAENYPDLKSNTNFLQLQGAWTESEDQIAAARRSYNAAVTEFNNAVQMFPSNLFAGIMSLSTLPVLETPAEERENISAKALFETNA
ncbi:MAG: LemA family protein [Pedobacter sp.]|nr:MAG: LemA family protein [Pedobacter sp.]